jgi:hypothetical protein
MFPAKAPGADGNEGEQAVHQPLSRPILHRLHFDRKNDYYDHNLAIQEVGT